MFLEARPEQFPITSAQLSMEQAALMGAIVGAAGPMVPVPAALDEVSQMAAAAFADCAAHFSQATNDAYVKGVCGAEVLGPVGAGYGAADASGSALVSANPVMVLG
ncbi:PE domain-containing protein [Nocardia iowensis]|uniref:PE domain-containing protein n=1 Tax=Nocardia iowensis TaxID=204891 RepID=A0ABX8RYG2_NOCIO|nr:PE domain-containing protein [Nocardia iowensis]QXN94673.1 PE domain-containing protein [Nocardia iowensis]